MNSNTCTLAQVRMGSLVRMDSLHLYEVGPAGVLRLLLSRTLHLHPSSVQLGPFADKSYPPVLPVFFSLTLTHPLTKVLLSPLASCRPPHFSLSATAAPSACPSAYRPTPSRRSTSSVSAPSAAQAQATQESSPSTSHRLLPTPSWPPSTSTPSPVDPVNPSGAGGARRAAPWL